MKKVDEIKKIEAVVLYILGQFKDGIDYIKLFKIMYFAQREYLATYGLTVVDDSFKARQRGPVPALTYKVVKMAENGDVSQEASDDVKSFASAIRVDDTKKVYALQKPNMDYISKMAQAEIDKTVAKYRDIDSQALSELSHDDAYLAVIDRMKDDPQKDVLTLIDIARAGGAPEPMIDHIREIQLIKAALA
ncbi:MAG: SocA family protein [Bacteroidales bacterium]|nr:SocA family protein [Bacteroidales bacterium]